MHLLNVDTLKLETFYDEQVPKYAILSHTWGEEEVTFADIQDPTSDRTTSLAGFDKIRRTCEQARADGYSYAWVDTCCIDKSSSAELSEAINAMFRWYKNAAVCYAYLVDVLQDDFEATFPKSRWFTRGWTLQELLAPQEVVFYDCLWTAIGTKTEHVDRISIIAGIDAEALSWGADSLRDFSIANRMSWAANRKTTRAEDTAYGLIGIFGINMPLLYGEGDRAFTRLQHELMRTSNDDSIFAWGLEPPTPGRPLFASDDPLSHRAVITGGSPLLATSPGAFRNCGSIQPCSHSALPFAMNNVGLQIGLPLVNLRHKIFVGVLNCWSSHRVSTFLGIYLLLEDQHLRDTGSLENWIRLTTGVPEELPWQTCHIPPRVAMRTTFQQITISHTTGRPPRKSLPSGPNFLLLNSAKALDDKQFFLSHAWTQGGWGSANAHDWDKTSRVLKVMYGDTGYVVFRHVSSCDAFTVVVLSRGHDVTHPTAIACDSRRLPDFTDPRQLWRFVEARQKEGNLRLQASGGRKMLVKVTLKENEAIRARRLLEVFVDLVPVENG